jgi:ABC-2 type transport system ATP-binding protein
MLAGLVRPTSGGAAVCGHSPGSSGSLSKIGCLIENPAFYPYLSGRDNLRVIAGYSGANQRLVDEVLQEVDLRDRSGHRVATYSLGMKQRLAIAAALLKEPEVLLLDEPTNGLDPQGMAEVRALVKSLQGTQRAVLVSSHLLHEVEQMCNRVGVIHQGRLVMQGSVAELRGDSTTITVEASPFDLAKKVLVEMLGAAAVGERDGVLFIRGRGFDAAEINRGLVQAGVAVADFHQTQRSLEEAFFALTGSRSEET